MLRAPVSPLGGVQFLCCVRSESQIEGVQTVYWNVGGIEAGWRQGVQEFWRGRGGWKKGGSD